MFLCSLYVTCAKLKAGLQCCCSADRGSGIACKPEQTTVKPTPYVLVPIRKYACTFDTH